MVYFGGMGPLGAQAWLSVWARLLAAGRHGLGVVRDAVPVPARASWASCGGTGALDGLSGLSVCVGWLRLEGRYGCSVNAGLMGGAVFCGHGGFSGLVVWDAALDLQGGLGGQGLHHAHHAGPAHGT